MFTERIGWELRKFSCANFEEQAKNIILSSTTRLQLARFGECSRQQVCCVLSLFFVVSDCTKSVSLHFRVVKKSPVVVRLDPNSKSYQDAVRHNVALIRKCEENKPREREFNAAVKLTALQKEMDQPKPNLAWIASQLRAGTVRRRKCRFCDIFLIFHCR